MTAADPNDPLGYDLSCWDDLDPSMAEVSGAAMMDEVAHRRINTSRGQLITDMNYGINVWDILSAEATPAQVAQVSGLVDQELLKDDRIQSSSSALDTTVTPNTLATVLQAATGPFSQIGPLSPDFTSDPTTYAAALAATTPALLAAIMTPGGS